MKKLIIYLIFISLGLSGNLFALTYPPLSFGEFLQQSSQIFVGTVKTIEFLWEESPRGEELYTTITIEVETGLRGNVGRQIVLREFGGEDPEKNIGMMIAGAPRLELGRKFVFFLHGNPQHEIPYTQGERGVLQIVEENGQEVVRTYSGRPVLGIEKEGFKVGPGKRADADKIVARVVHDDGIVSEYVPPESPAPIALGTFLSQLKTLLRERGL